jgi:hypothetical protein
LTAGFSWGFPNNADRSATLFLGHAPFVVWPQVSPPFQRGNQRVFAFVRHDSGRFCQAASTNSIRTALPNARATRETVDNLTSSA